MNEAAVNWAFSLNIQPIQKLVLAFLCTRESVEHGPLVTIEPEEIAGSCGIPVRDVSECLSALAGEDHVFAHYYPGENLFEISLWMPLGRVAPDEGPEVCAYCGAPASERDHIVPRCQGGSNHPSNLTWSCSRCNQRKGGRTPMQAGMVVLCAT